MRDTLPATAAWRHRDARDGFEVVFCEPLDDGWRFRGHSVAVEEDEPWGVGYVIDVDATWCTRAATITSRSAGGDRSLALAADGAGRWTADGEPLPAGDGHLDVDLESSALTNAFPVRRMGLAVGASAPAPAVYVRAADLAVERLEQRYERLPDGDDGERYEYHAPRFGFRCEIRYDAAGLAVTYPGVAVRVR